MATLEPFLVLAEAVSEGRMSPSEFSLVCLPLYKSYGGPHPSAEHYQAAADLFYVAHDYDSAGVGMPDLLNDDQVRQKAAEIAQRMRVLLQ
ncbi:hypothetical protein [Streptomyces sp. AC550_RSS872]|uniref:hypothetical protein n=1 Tax=Streptomyces sp. AC550_RSS872 TaxID=2823689 RepID=UPI001C261B4A|nr:hypothetical protein [Streptomyces sp. AC550_RSS872]